MSIHRECPAPEILTTLTLLCNFDHGLPWLPLLLLLLIQAPPSATAQLPNWSSPPPADNFSKFKINQPMLTVLVILVVVFFILGFLSVYTRQCAVRRMRGRLELTIPIVGNILRPRGLEPEIIDTFPTFVYSTVKGLKIGRATLECAVCLNEFQDDETLRLIPKCSHVFHPQCIDVWLSTHSTCPVCRANLVPKPGDMSSVAIQIPDPAGVGSNQPDPEFDSDGQPRHDYTLVDEDDNGNGAGVAESPKANFVNQNRPLQSKSTGFGMASLFPRSHSTGHSVVQPGENCERFTLRLPEEVRNRLVSSTLSRANSRGVTLTRESSGRKGYRARSMGSVRGRSFLQYERTPQFESRAGSTRSTKGSADANKPPLPMDNVGEQSSDRLFPLSTE